MTSDTLNAISIVSMAYELCAEKLWHDIRKFSFNSFESKFLGSFLQREVVNELFISEHKWIMIYEL